MALADAAAQDVEAQALLVAREDGNLEDLMRVLIKTVTRRPPIDAAVEQLRNRGDGHAVGRAIDLLKLSLATGVFPY
ncbi:MAG TPA: hypothetical protein VFA11_07720 [Acidimicrobiales bacterium]|nr:hypothetical protein [Acidimicrobiales bacterium]